MVRQKSSGKLHLMLGIWLIRALVVSVGQNFVLVQKFSPATIYLWFEGIKGRRLPKYKISRQPLN